MIDSLFPHVAAPCKIRCVFSGRVANFPRAKFDRKTP